MPTSSLRRKTLFLLLIVSLVASWTSAAGSASETFRTERALEVIDGDLLGRLWSVVLVAWGKEGCMIDPDGCCLPKTPPPPAKAGCMIDPDGVPRCAP